jgi:hypothetical protein
MVGGEHVVQQVRLQQQGALAMVVSTFCLQGSRNMRNCVTIQRTLCLQVSGG